MKHRLQRALTWSAVTVALAGTAYGMRAWSRTAQMAHE